MKKRLEKFRLPIPVEGSDGVDEALRKRGERIAGMVRLAPHFAALGLDAEGGFVLWPDDLVLTSFGGGLDEIENPFEGRVVRAGGDAASLSDALRGRGEEFPWPFGDWLTHSVDAGYNVLAVREPGGDRWAGFVSYRRGLDVIVDEDGGIELDYYVAPEYVYVAPDCRGMRVSSALRRAVMADVLNDVDELARLAATKRFRDLDHVSLRLRVTGEAHSDEGNAFLEALTANVEERVIEAFDPADAERLGCDGVEPDFSL